MLKLNNREKALKQLGEKTQRELYEKYDNPHQTLDFSKIRLAGNKSLEDAVLALGDLKTTNKRLADKQTVLNAIDNQDLNTQRKISNFFFKISGIYSRLCRHLAYLYRYDYVVTPLIAENANVPNEKIISSFYNVSNFLDNFEVKKYLGETALKVIKNGC